MTPPQSRFILVSESPRRKALLERLGVPFDTAINTWVEFPRPHESAKSQAKRFSEEKLIHYLQNRDLPSIPVFSADTLLSFRGRPLGKPADETEAWSIYKALAGRTHQVITSISLFNPRRKRLYHYLETTFVTFCPWDDKLYSDYLARKEWHDAAGGYKIQESGEVIVRAIRGSWSNVVGLPIGRIYGILRQHHCLDPQD